MKKKYTSDGWTIFQGEHKISMIQASKLLNEYHQENENLKTCITNQGIIIEKLLQKLQEYQSKEKQEIVLTKKDIETMDKAISYYTHEEV